MKRRIQNHELSENEIDEFVIAQADDYSAWERPIKVRQPKPLVKKVLNYRVLLRKEPEGGYTVIVPSLSGCVTYGDTVEQALKMAKEAIELYLEA